METAGTDGAAIGGNPAAVGVTGEKAISGRSTMKLHDRIRRYLAERILYVDDGLPYDDDSSFIGEGLIDSMGVMELVSFVQSEFGLKVEPQELTPEHFDSVNKLAAYIGRKVGAEQPAAR
jgi:acyl carrier protein